MRPSAIVVGASSGIGYATALKLAEAGYDLLLVGRSLDRLTRCVEEVRTLGGGGIEVQVMAVDVTQPAAPAGIVRAASEAFGRIDALANIAGYAPATSIEEITPQQWRKVVDTNLSYVMYLTAAVWPVFRQQKGGTIVNVSSVAAFEPYEGFAMYAAAKAGLNVFTRVTAMLGDSIGVRAVCIAPGPVETPMLRSTFDEKAVPPDKALKPGQVAQVIVDCITGQRKFENGQTIVLAGPGSI